MAIIAMLMAILIPALSTSRTEGTKVKCLSNMRSLGQAMAMYSSDDTNGFTSPVHPKAETSWLYDGEYEYGGSTGVGVFQHRDFISENRVLNRYLFANGQSSPFGLYECPSDTGISPAPYDFEPYFLHPSRASLQIHRITGTSYRLNNHIDFTGQLDPRFQTHFYGPYMRPVSQVPDPGQTVILEETVAEVAKWNRDHYVLGWHRKANRFNVSFVDGHAGAIFLSGQDGDAEVYGGYWVLRGEGWRMDCYPSLPVLDLPRRATSP